MDEFLLLVFLKLFFKFLFERTGLDIVFYFSQNHKNQVRIGVATSRCFIVYCVRKIFVFGQPIPHISQHCVKFDMKIKTECRVGWKHSIVSAIS